MDGINRHLTPSPLWDKEVETLVSETEKSREAKSSLAVEGRDKAGSRPNFFVKSSFNSSPYSSNFC